MMSAPHGCQHMAACSINAPSAAATSVEEDEQRGERTLIADSDLNNTLGPC